MAWEDLQEGILELFSDVAYLRDGDPETIERARSEYRMEKARERARDWRWKHGADNMRDRDIARCHGPGCRARFKPRVGGKPQKYCSRACRQSANEEDRQTDAARRERHQQTTKAWRLAHPEKVKQRHAESYQRRKDSLRGRKREQRRQKRIAEVGTPTCRGCGIALPWRPDEKKRVPVWCTERCRGTWRSAQARLAREHSAVRTP